MSYRSASLGHMKSAYLDSLGGGSTLLNGLVSWWNMDEESGTRADSVGSNDLTDVNTAGYDTGKSGNAVLLVKANNEKLRNSGQNILFPTEDYSVSCWIKGDISLLDATYGGGVVSSMESGSNGSWAVNINNSGNIFWYHWGEESCTNSVADGRKNLLSAVITNTWTHITVVHASGTFTIYVDGTGSAPDTETATAGGWGSSDLQIGAMYSTSTYNYDGLIDLVGVWDRALTADEITELYNAGAGKDYPFS